MSLEYSKLKFQPITTVLEVVHTTPAIKEDCEHEWAEDEEGQPEYCKKCMLSFTRYIFCCCP